MDESIDFRRHWSNRGGVIERLLCQTDDSVTVTSRSRRTSLGKAVNYVQGNAKDRNFLERLLSGKQYDVILDFMSYATEEFRERHELLLDHTRQYIFISSARVYAQSEEAITEKTPRLLDVSDDSEYLATDEYALAKARCEDLLFASKKQNYTIIRPSITYGENRLQLGVLEKENWLYRALQGRSIVFSEDIAPKITAMTHSGDVARGILALLGKEEALGEVFHITSEKCCAWEDVLECYLGVLEDVLGIRPKVFMTKQTVKLKLEYGKYQAMYCRYYNRRFDNSKIRKFVDPDSFLDPLKGLDASLRQFLKHPKFRGIDWTLEAWQDRAAQEHTPMHEILPVRKKISYLCRRHGLDGILDTYRGN